MKGLSSFIEEKIAGYQEPFRRGTPKGEPIGLSRKKYRASLLLMKSGSREEIVAQARVSYSLLGKWLTEEPFRSALQQASREFGEIFIQNLLAEARTINLVPSDSEGWIPMFIKKSKILPISSEYSTLLCREIVILFYEKREDKWHSGIDPGFFLHWVIKATEIFFQEKGKIKNFDKPLTKAKLNLAWKHLGFFLLEHPKINKDVMDHPLNKAARLIHNLMEKFS